MSYQVLARKWRPGNFNEMAGQGHVLQTLINALDSQRLHHAYLFTGTRGVGKTTLARILAKCLNCETGISSNPCGKCESCVEISEGRFMDLIEVDAASRTKVEDTRELLENVQYTPARGRFKVYLIDEVHMLSNHSFNALLKTLEEPPPHVKFLFATTDPQKLPVTVLSRCLQFSLKNLSAELISDYLKNVLQQESIEFEIEAIWHIAEAAAGSMRDALTLTDQAIAYCQGTITETGVVDMLGIPDHRKIFDLMQAMTQADINRVLEIVAELAGQAASFQQILDKLLSLLHRIALAQVLPQSVDGGSQNKAEISKLAAAVTAEDVQLFYQFGLKGREDLAQATDVRVAFEMLLLRMLVFAPSPVTQQTDANSPQADQSRQAEQPDKSEKSQTSDLEKKKSPNDLIKTPVVAPPAPIDTNARTDPKESVSREPDRDKPVISLAVLTHVNWLDWFAEIEVSGITANLLSNCIIDKVNDNVISLILDEKQSGTYSEDQKKKIEAVLSEFFATQIATSISIGSIENSGVETVAAQRQRLRREQHEKMVEDFEQDPNVQQILGHFSATLAKTSITSIKD